MGAERVLESNMIVDILFIWIACYAVARIANSLTSSKKPDQPSPEEQQQRRLDELYGRR